jgi:TRAP-type uncharacterized transport system fused permease subunit
VIPPPVALSAYAAAAISGADSNATAIEAVRLGFVKLLVPFLFVSMQGLLMIGSAETIVATAVVSAIGVGGLSIAFAGWLGVPLPMTRRLAIGGAALMVLVPIPVTFDALNLAVRLAGCIVLALLILRTVRGAYSYGRPT